MAGVRTIAVMTVGGVRGAVTLAGVLSIPVALSDGTPLPGRDTAIFVASAVILGSLIVAVMVIVRPGPYVPAAELVEKPVTTGGTVSIEIGGDNSPTTFPFRAGSVNVPAATETDPAEVESAVGVKVAV